MPSSVHGTKCPTFVDLKGRDQFHKGDQKSSFVRACSNGPIHTSMVLNHPPITCVVLRAYIQYLQHVVRCLQVKQSCAMSGFSRFLRVLKDHSFVPRVRVPLAVSGSDQESPGSRDKSRWWKRCLVESDIPIEDKSDSGRAGRGAASKGCRCCLGEREGCLATEASSLQYNTLPLE